MFKKIVLYILLVAYAQALFAQTADNPDYFTNKVTISSPNAASLGKYGDVPISYHTGIPDISVPIYTVTDGPLSLPITLSYHASGLKVEENASWVGAGWALNAGGVITRSVRGLPDDRATQSQLEVSGYYSEFGYYNYNDFTTGYANNPYYGGGVTYTKPFYSGWDDGEPDLYFFNVNGHSGKFYFRADRTPVLVPEGDEKITVDYMLTSSNTTLDSLGRVEGIRGFIITTADGVRYYFGKYPNQRGNGQIEINTPVTLNTSPPTQMQGISNVASSWYLYKIQSADGQFNIRLTYTPEIYSYYLLGTQDVSTISYNSSNASGQEYKLRKNYVQGQRLTSITFSNGRVDFLPGALRKDLSADAVTNNAFPMNDIGNVSATTLGSVSIKNLSNTEIKRFNFTYDYFYDSSPLTGQLYTNYVTNASTTNPYNITSDQYRLKLLSIQEVASNGAVNPPYKFDYFTEQVPRKLSFGRDHWGFINGANSNQQLISTFSINGQTYQLANREPAWPAMRGGTLSKITYPTGGNVQFDFEPNTFWIVNSTYPQGTNAIVGGLRIKTITKNDGISAPNVTNYDYSGSTSGQSSGILYGKPTLISIIENDAYKKFNAYLQLGTGCIISGNDVGSVVSPTSVRPMDAVQGNHIGYGQVKVSQTGNGFSIYQYFAADPYFVNPNFPNGITNDDIVVRNLPNSAICPSEPSYPYPPLPYDFIRGNLKYEGHFNEQGVEIKRTDYSMPDFVKNIIETPGYLAVNAAALVAPGSKDLYGNSLVTEFVTEYQLNTSKKTHQQITETLHSQDGSNDIVTTTDMYYGSPYHHQLTSKVTTNSKGDLIKTNYTYAPDFRITAVDAVDNGQASFQSNINKNYQDYINNHNTLFSNLYSTGTLDPNLNDKIKYMNIRYDYDLSVSWKAYIANYYSNNTFATNYKSAFESARSGADAILKPIIDLQANNILHPIEITQWKNNTLLGASFNAFANTAYPGYSYYPGKLQQLYALSPLTDFTSAAVNGSTIKQDSRYEDAGYFAYSSGNLVDAQENYGAHNAYIWGYNNRFPIVKIANASNQALTTVQQNTDTVSLPVQGGSQTINVGYSGNVTLTFKLSGNPTGSAFSSSIKVTITGPYGYSQTITLCSSNTTCASGNSTSLVNINTAGTYTITTSNLVVNNFNISNSTSSVTATYPSNITSTQSMTSEFYYEGFEESTLTGVVTGTAHTGIKYYSGATFPVTWLPPTGSTRSFVISYWYLNSSGTWVYVPEAAYTPTNGKYTLSQTGATGYDEIRICPKDAQMTTYTYDPLIGMTSSTDAKGETTYYEYDSFMRLMNIKDKDGNIIKHIDYHYQGQ